MTPPDPLVRRIDRVTVWDDVYGVEHADLDTEGEYCYYADVAALVASLWALVDEMRDGAPPFVEPWQAATAKAWADALAARLPPREAAKATP